MSRTSQLELTGPRAAVPVVGAFGAAVVVAVAALAFSGQLAAAGPFDSGPLVKVGLPIARSVHDLAAAVTIGLLVIGVWCIAPDRGTRDADVLDGVRERAVRWGAVAAAIWLLAATAVLALTAADVSGVPFGSPGFSTVLLSFVQQVDLGRELGVSALLVAVTVALSLTATRIVSAAVAAVVALLAVLPLALGGHAAGAAHHMNAVDSLAMHLVGVCLWVGGLAAVVLLASRLRDQLPTVVARYSRLALASFALVALSGVVNALLRLPSITDVASTYGLLVLAKTGALLVLGAVGLWHRRISIAQLGTRPRLFWRIAAVEVAVLGATVGLGVALSRTPPPGPEEALDPATALLGFPAPAPLTWERYLTAFYPELLWWLVGAGGAVLYLVAVLRLAGRGDRWPWSRTLAWVAGCVLLLYATSGGPGVYGRLHFSTHMLQHMVLMVVIPLLWVLGAPITLALRALRPRRDRSFGARETLLRLVHSAPLRLLGQPIVAAALFTIGLIVFYYTSLFDLALFTHAGHMLMTAHFLAAGYLLVWSLVGLDPGPARPGHPFRLLILFIVLGFHAFFGITMMSSSGLLAPDWWHALGQTDDAALLADQQTGGAIAWAAGDLPGFLIGVALLVAWLRDDTRRARQLDRQADRDGDAELRAANERLAALARMDERE